MCLFPFADSWIRDAYFCNDKRYGKSVDDWIRIVAKTGGLSEQEVLESARALQEELLGRCPGIDTAGGAVLAE